VQHLGIAAPVTSPKRGTFNVVASPLNLEGIAKKVRSATPEAGEHTEEILRGIGYTDAQIGSMRASGII
jgi:formyl-CoA transferase